MCDIKLTLEGHGEHVLTMSLRQGKLKCQPAQIIFRHEICFLQHRLVAELKSKPDDAQL